MVDILLVDDDASQLRLLGRWLEREGWTVAAHQSGRQGLAALTETLPRVIVLDLYLDGEDGLAILKTLTDRHPGLPVIMLTGESRVDVVVTAMQLGASDYLTKPIGRTHLIDTLRAALEKSTRVVAAREEAREAHGGGFGPMIGRSPPMLALFRELDRVAPSEVTVLVQGESGTGKELVARALHDGSGRAAGPFVALNCAAIPESLQESELFGHEKGAFTGATAQRPGRFEQADGGTLFLDEVGELSAALQAKLLRVLQERSFFRVGGNKELSVDVRIVAATHRDLETAASEGSFRQDLFYRLAVYEMALPALRDRGDDVLELARALLQSKRGGAELELSADVERALQAYAWPGNVRELDNAMARAAVSATDSVTLADLPPRVRRGAPEPIAADAASPNGLKPLEVLERKAILEAIAAHDGNLSAVMRQLDIPRTTFYRRLKAFGIDP